MPRPSLPEATAFALFDTLLNNPYSAASSLRQRHQPKTVNIRGGMAMMHASSYFKFPSWSAVSSHALIPLLVAPLHFPLH